MSIKTTNHTPETLYNTIATLLAPKVESLGTIVTDGFGHKQYGTITKVALLGSIDLGDRLIVPEPAAESPAFEIAMKGRTKDGYKDDRFVLFKTLLGPAILAVLPSDAGDFDDPDQEVYNRELQGARLVITTEENLAALNGIVIGIRDKFGLGQPSTHKVSHRAI